MNLDELPEVLKAVHAFQWSVLLACPRISERLSRPVPVEMVRKLVERFAHQTPEALVDSYQGIRRDYDPAKAFNRARQKAAALHACMDGWSGSLPVPKEVMMSARELVSAYGHKATGQWDEYGLQDDFEAALLWPDSPDVPHGRTGKP